MGVFGALNSAVSGLRAQSFALENISGNIANSQTTGFKRQDTSFAEIVTDGGATQAVQNAGSVSAFSRATNDLQGNPIAVDQETFVAISGDGYFIVSEAVDVIDGNTIFNGQDFFTRAGDFNLSGEGFFENGSGYFLQGFPLDPATGNQTGGLPEVIQIDTNQFLPAVPSTLIEFQANLPSFPNTTTSDPNVAETELLAPSLRGEDLTAVPPVPAGDTGDATIGADQTQLFLDSSIAGGSTTLFTPLGDAVDIQFRFAKTETALTAGNDDIYNLYFLSDNSATGTDPAWTRVNQQYAFDTNGLLDPQIENVVINHRTVNGSNFGDVTVNHGVNGITQFSTPSGVASANVDANGFPAGIFETVAISDGGRVTVTFSNDQSVDVAEIGLASFNADSQLRRIDGGGAFAATALSGPPILGASGSILGSTLEASNTDIADEFTKLIVTQQAYTANSRVVTAADELLTEVINIL
ncbi:MAG: flagellar hook-basal body complex protein [Pseudomonadota bacterium]